MYKYLAFIWFSMTLVQLFGQNNNYSLNPARESKLFVIAAPSIFSEYYSDFFDTIIEFEIQLVNKLRGKDSIIILADKPTLKYLKDKVAPDKLLKAEIIDIRLGDFAPGVPGTPIKFNYYNPFHKKKLSEQIDISFRDWMKDMDIFSNVVNCDLLLDAGNFVKSSGYYSRG